MKTYNDLWESVTSFENLCKAFYKAKKGRSGNPEILYCFFNLEKKLFNIQEELLSQTYKTGKYRVFKVYEPKERIIKAVPFRDRIVHHALCNVVEPIFESRFIFDSFACRKRKGSHKGLKRVRHVIQNCFKGRDGYALKCDVKKYFPSVDHNKLKEIIKKRIKDENVIKVVNEIIDSDNSQFGWCKGIPIGNLTSQLFANIYLNELDQFVKHKLRVRHYFRYVDDFLIFSESKQQLHVYKHEIKTFLKTICLTIPQEKTRIFKIKDGVDFVGYKIHPEFTRLRKSNIKKFSKRIKILKRLLSTNAIQKTRVEASMQSWFGHASHANAYKIVSLVMQKTSPDFTYLFLHRCRKAHVNQVNYGIKKVY